MIGFEGKTERILSFPPPCVFIIIIIKWWKASPVISVVVALYPYTMTTDIVRRLLSWMMDLMVV